MRLLVFLFSILIGSCYAQDELDSNLYLNEEEDESIVTFEGYVGSFLSQNGFGSRFNSFESYDIIKPMQFFGVSMSVLFGEDDVYDEATQISLSKFIPLKVFVNDSLSVRMSGYNFGSSF